MHKMVKLLFAFFGSIIGGWVGASLDHNDWVSFPSIFLSIVGVAGGIWLAYKLDDFIEM